VTDEPLDVDNLVLSPTAIGSRSAWKCFRDCDGADCTKKRLDEREKENAPAFSTTSSSSAIGTRGRTGAGRTSSWRERTGRRGRHHERDGRRFSVQAVWRRRRDLVYPDGKAVVFTPRDVGKEEAWSTDFDLYLAPIDGSKAPECLTTANDAWDTQPVFSPDGKTLAYLAMKRRATRRTASASSSAMAGRERARAHREWDRSPAESCGRRDGKRIFSTAPNIGQNLSLRSM